MSDSQKDMPEEEIASVDVSQRAGFSIFWVIPLVALMVGVWMTGKAYIDQGPLVTIEFKNAAGVIAKKTRVRMHDVEIGVVESVVLSDDLERVIVKARLTKESKKMMVEGTQFWVEVPRVTATEVKGLQTILSGVFIGIDPAKGGRERYEFIGLDNPPFLVSKDKGRFFILHADSRGSANKGSPIIYRGIDVGQVVSYEMNDEGSSVNIKIFIKKPFYHHINLNTRFWEVSGINLKLSAEGFEVNTESIVSILIGGITFGTPDYLGKGEVAPDNHEFKMFLDQELAFKRTYRKRQMLLYFDGSVRGLKVGAPVEFRGINIGEVVDLRLQFNAEDFSLRIPVTIDIEPDRLEMIGEMDAVAVQGNAREVKDNMQWLVDNGMRAQLKTGSLLTGAQFVDLDMYPNLPAIPVTTENGVVIIPTIPTAIDAIVTGVTTVLDKIAAMPLEQIGHDLGGTIKRVRELVEGEEIESAIHSLNLALKETEAFTKSMNTTITPQVDATLRELKNASRSIKAMADYLERHPEALIKGKAGGR